MNSYVKNEANNDFARARTREKIQKILNLLDPVRDQMLSLREVRDLLKPSSETYVGLKVVPVDRIVGSEGRYADFNKRFLPRHEHLRTRWTRVDQAHLADIPLPAIRVYEIGGVYFVRDGNHRVSVARAQGAIGIDAEVVALDTEIPIDPEMTRDDLLAAVVEYEKRRFYHATRFDRLFPEYDLVFTSTGRYDEILTHVSDHKYYMNMNQDEEILFERALKSWFKNVYIPIIRVIRNRKLLSRFPRRTEADLYVWLVKHWDDLKRAHGGDYDLEKAAEDFSGRFGTTVWKRIANRWARRKARIQKERRIRKGELQDGDLD